MRIYNRFFHKTAVLSFGLSLLFLFLALYDWFLCKRPGELWIVLTIVCIWRGACASQVADLFFEDGKNCLLRFAYKEILIPLDTLHISDVQINRPMTVTINYHRYMIAYTRKNYDTLKELLRYGCYSNVSAETLEKLKERSRWSMDC